MAVARSTVRPRDVIPFALALSRAVPGRALLGFRPALARLLFAVPSLRKPVQSRMAAALGPEAVPAGAVRSYFEHVADLVTFSLLTMRDGFARAGLAAQFEVGEGEQTMRAAQAGGRGVLMVGGHLVCHELAAARWSMCAPTTAIIRHSSDPAHEARKVAWYRATGMEVVYRPDGAGSEMREMAAALRALRENRVLGITPDLLQQPGKGVEVTLFGRRAWLPPGPAFLASRTGAPFLPCFFQKEGSRYRLSCDSPIEVPATGDRDVIVREAMQEWCGRFERFLRRHPDMWLFWLDRRWGRWLESPREEVIRC